MSDTPGPEERTAHLYGWLPPVPLGVMARGDYWRAANCTQSLDTGEVTVDYERLAQDGRSWGLVKQRMHFSKAELEGGLEYLTTMAVWAIEA